MKIEVIMSAYNNPVTLSIVLDGYLEQTDKDFCITVADDGSTAEVEDVCALYKKKGLLIKHVWHEDNGFRRSAIMNKAISESDAEYIIMTDSDCIPMKYFIADHRRYAEKGRLVVGRRVDLKKDLTDKFVFGDLAATAVNSNLFLMINGVMGRLKRAEFGIRFPLLISIIMSRKKRGALGANMAAWRTDLLAVNGFDNDFIGYGMEETDLEWRLNKVNVLNKTVIGRAVLVHLYHKERKGSPDSRVIFENKIKAGIVKVRNGICKK
ncbi:glycosyltransferase [Aeromonas sp. S16(2024)]|uniref:glycosyltransferase n=1 Tax=Aeromonas sp. S16(2024) TaxID=3242889 RepID=UPI0035285786